MSKSKKNNFQIKKKAISISIAVSLILFSLKVAAFKLTGSDAIFSDAAESIVNIVATIMALASIIISSKPPDRDHLYGHGNVEFFSAGIEGFLIIVAALSIIYSSIGSLLHGSELSRLDFGTLIIAGAGGVNLLLGLYLIKKGRLTNSITLIADGKHMLTDSVTSFGVVAGLVVVLITDLQILDPIVAILVAVNIIFTGSKLMRASFGGLMKEADKRISQKISTLILKNKSDYWIDIHNLRFWTSGDKIHVDFHMILPFYFTIEKSHEIEDKIRAQLSTEFPNHGLLVHFDYCDFNLCKYCQYQDCSERKEKFTIPYILNQDNIFGEGLRYDKDEHLDE